MAMYGADVISVQLERN